MQPPSDAALSLRVVSADGHSVDVALHEPSGELHAVLLFLSALGTPARVYRRLGKELASHGIAVCTPDWRGIASSSIRAGRRNDFGYRHLLEFDLPALRSAIAQRYPHKPLWIGGHSLGGQLALVGTAAQPTDISGIVLIASGSVHLSAYPPKWRRSIRLLTAATRVIGPILGYFPGNRFGFGGREAHGLMRDWSHVAHTGAYRPRHSTVDYEAHLRTLALPVLAISFASDQWSPPTAVKTLLAKAPASRITHEHWTPADTENQALDHFSWTKQPALVAPAIARFVREQPNN
jgi:predicted alpha/beta hydrolase